MVDGNLIDMNIKDELKFDYSKPVNMIFDHKGTQVLHVNTENPEVFLEEALKFDVEVQSHLDKRKRCKIMYVIDKVPPLSAILKFVENPFEGVEWGAYAVILPEDLSILNKFIPVVTFGLNITHLKNKHIMKVFDHTYRENLQEVFNWLDENVEKKPDESKVLGI